jgi:ferrous iron transport protein A
VLKCLKIENRRSCCPADHADSSVLPLADARVGQRCKVAAIDGGRQLCARMAAMGIYPGVEMEVLCAGCNCPCLVRVHGCTLSLGSGMSNKILVTKALH